MAEERYLNDIFPLTQLVFVIGTYTTNIQTFCWFFLILNFVICLIVHQIAESGSGKSSFLRQILKQVTSNGKNYVVL